MKRVNFREVNKKLNSLKKTLMLASLAYEDLKSVESLSLLIGARNELGQFRNTKISEGI